MNKKKILIFGSSGFIGSNLINKISKKKYTIIKVNRNKFLSLNLEKRLNFFKKCDFVFHLANQNNSFRTEKIGEKRINLKDRFS